MLDAETTTCERGPGLQPPRRLATGDAVLAGADTGVDAAAQPSSASIRATWVLTVASDGTSRAAISALDSPRATWSSTSRHSLGQACRRPGVAAGP
jgi:hypothetical protein